MENVNTDVRVWRSKLTWTVVYFRTWPLTRSQVKTKWVWTPLCFFPREVTVLPRGITPGESDTMKESSPVSTRFVIAYCKKIEWFVGSILILITAILIGSISAALSFPILAAPREKSLGMGREEGTRAHIPEQRVVIEHNILTQSVSWCSEPRISPNLKIRWPSRRCEEYVRIRSVSERLRHCSSI